MWRKTHLFIHQLPLHRQAKGTDINNLQFTCCVRLPYVTHPSREGHVAEQEASDPKQPAGSDAPAAQQPTHQQLGMPVHQHRQHDLDQDDLHRVIPRCFAVSNKAADQARLADIVYQMKTQLEKRATETDIPVECCCNCWCRC